jgi:alpha-methylacyl-CoA racemase
MLADLGADVIKIEDPHGGDHARQMPPLVDGTSVYFTILNRNKRSVSLNLRAPGAAGVLDALVPRCDVVIDSFRPSTARRFGVDPESLERRNADVICASISGFGAGGPYADKAAHDINYEALAGLLSLSGGDPRVPGLLVGDIGAAHQAAFFVVASLFARERGARPPAVNVSIHEAALQWMQFPSARHLVPGGGQDPRQLPLRGESARYNVYQTADGEWIALGALEEKFWSAFCQRIGRPDLAQMQDMPGEAQARALADVRALMKTRTRAEWLAFFDDVDVCLTPINSVPAALADAEKIAPGSVTRHRGVSYIGARVNVRPAPALGADTDEVLEEAGIDAERRRELRSAGVI